MTRIQLTLFVGAVLVTGCGGGPELDERDQSSTRTDTTPGVTSPDDGVDDGADGVLRETVAGLPAEVELDDGAESVLAETARIARSEERQTASAERRESDVPSILSEPDDYSSGDKAESLEDALSELSKELQGDPDAGAVAEDPGSTEPARVGAAAQPVAEAPLPEEPKEVVLRSADDAALKPPAEAAPTSKPEKPSRPPGKTTFYTFFHKSAVDFIDFVRRHFPDYVGVGHIVLVDGKSRTVLLFGDDAVLPDLTKLADEFDNLELELQRVTLYPKYLNVDVLVESLTMAGLCNVWSRVEETVSAQQLQGKNWKTTVSHKHDVYSQGSIAKGQGAPVNIPRKIPYVFEMPWSDPFVPPPVSTGKGESGDQYTLDFRNSASTEKRGAVVAVGTTDDIERIKAFVDSIDRPARQIMIEVQVIELNADRLTDLGIDSFQAGEGNSIVNFSGPLPGEGIRQPGILPGEDFRGPDARVPNIVSEGISYLFDDTSLDLSGRFIATVHFLVRTGDAKVKARPKILTLDDRQSILHIGEEVPTFESTGVTRETSGGNFVTEVNQITTQYVGFTLNMRPRISGDNDDEIALQLEVVSNQLRGRTQVFEEDLAGVPVIARRRFTGQPRVKNHRPIILGGLISEVEAESKAMVPILGEIPILGKLFSRTTKTQERTEIILVVTPHILSEDGPDPAATPKESLHFDTFDSVLFNDRHILKGGDVWGIDPVTKTPAMVKGEVFTEKEVIDLTLLNVVRRRRLVSKLNILSEYLPGEAAKLSWLQRKYPERSVYYWSDPEKEIYFKAAAIVIENIKELNGNLTYEDIVVPRREIVLPTTPYRMTLSYDKYKTLVDRGGPVLRDGETVELSRATLELLRDAASQRTLRQFADYVRRNEIKAEDHGDLKREIARLHRSLVPDAPSLDAAEYGEFLGKIAAARIDFVTISTYLQENFENRYVTTGRPNIGRFELDITDFLKTAVTITQRAKRLHDLERKWTALTQEEDV